MATDSKPDIREVLDELGQRRVQNDADGKKIAKETKAALKRARREKVPVSEVADRLGVHRTTLYRVYE